MKNINKKYITENEAFITLIEIAKEDKKIKNMLLPILRLDHFNRKSVLNTYISKMKLKNAPKNFTEAISYLLDDEIANKVLEIIEK
ncbi:MAG: hypothetical protein KAT05_09730 [Spirochaetes bacterium]|nr:hypothetical protein [Spirochaetota bacterium]